MKQLKLIGLLLDYPKDELWQYREELIAATAEVELAPERSEQLAQFAIDLLSLDPMDAQERWLGLFDRGRSMSLLLFEHIHGESRDRGQAMVDLLQNYREHGFELSSRELPDYLPLVLEYLAQQPPEEGRDWLHHCGHILELLAARALERESPYGLLFQILVEFAGCDGDLALARKRAASEPRDDTPQAIDQVWEEEAVRFGNDAPPEDCAPPRRLPAGAVVTATAVADASSRG
jgi:nitrate reductase molybdenum cofactor assembly chaperone NarJ/NarW